MTDLGWPFDFGPDEARRRTLARDAGWPDRTVSADTPARRDLTDALVVFAFIGAHIHQPWHARLMEQLRQGIPLSDRQLTSLLAQMAAEQEGAA